MNKIIKMKGPLFVLGSPRSGTSLLRLILTTHPEIIIPPECGFIVWLHNKYSDWNSADNKIETRINSFITDLLKCRKFDTWLINEKFLVEQIINLQPQDYGELCYSVYATFGFRKNKNFSLWGDKNNFHVNHLNLLRNIFEKSLFLHIVRDGRDVACSYREVMSKKSDSPYAPQLSIAIEDIAFEWSNNIEKIDKFFFEIKKEEQLVIKYEDLVTNPSKYIKIICGWLKLDFHEEMLSFYEYNMKENLEPKLTIDWKKRTMQPISDATVGRYRYMLNENEQKLFCDIANKQLLKHLYY